MDKYWNLKCRRFSRRFLLTIFLFIGIQAKGQVLNEVTLQRVRVGIFISPPFVMVEEDGWYSGMAIDLWEMVENQLHLSTEYVVYNSLESLIKALQSGEIEIAVTNLTVTYDRAQIIKFSFPWYDAGLRIMVKDDQKGTLWDEMKRNGQLHSYLWIILIIVIITFLLTVFFRYKDPSYPKKWSDGIALSLYTLMVAVKTGALEAKELGWIGHVMSVIWMLFGIGLVAYVTSTITSSMTKITLTSEISTLYDLPGKLVGVEVGGVEEQYLATMSIRTLPYDNIMDAAEGLVNDKVHAVVGDAPVLEYWVHTNGGKNIKVAGNLFHPDKYAFAANKKHSDLMDRISVELIKLYDLGKIKELKDRYLGVINE
ncbi:transporter substrate-binding domain-containing protein [Dysgonomonas sp. ZJ279]|uniref:transporter substrate-binding domain-containing protein n=1 Tax=Dysgonomonas sp. ZJ279 TaxID=2709796 RepID=UPI0013EA0C0C|nr:transporter substrate-binding domain-containing protein [Dysgonomonas sp. ZJ279]